MPEHAKPLSRLIDALRHLGIDTLDFPYTPDRVWHAIRTAKGSG